MFYAFRVIGEGGGKELDSKFAARAFLDATGSNYKERFIYNKKLHKGDLKLMDIVLTDDSSEVDFIFGEIEFGGRGLILSEKALSLFLDFKLPPNKFFQVEVILNDKKSKKKYFWIQFVGQDLFMHIDFSLSSINVEDSNERVLTLKQYEKVTHFLTGSKIKVDKVTFKRNSPVFDIFEITGMGYFYWISEELKNCIEKNGLTGRWPITAAF